MAPNVGARAPRSPEGPEAPARGGKGHSVPPVVPVVAPASAGGPMSRDPRRHGRHGRHGQQRRRLRPADARCARWASGVRQPSRGGAADGAGQYLGWAPLQVRAHTITRCAMRPHRAARHGGQSHSGHSGTARAAGRRDRSRTVTRAVVMTRAGEQAAENGGTRQCTAAGRPNAFCIVSSDALTPRLWGHFPWVKGESGQVNAVSAFVAVTVVSAWVWVWNRPCPVRLVTRRPLAAGVEWAPRNAECRQPC